MAVRYVRSTDGNNADSGATWALAKLDLVGVAAIDTAGDTLWVSQAHAETTAGNITFNIAGSAVSPTKIVCGNDAAEPPTALATSATVSTTGASTTITMAGSSVYVYGITFTAGTTTQIGILVLASASTYNRYEQCNFVLGGSNVGNRIQQANGSWVHMKDCGVKFSSSSHRIEARSRWTWNGGSVLAGGTSPVALINPVNSNIPGDVLVENVDLSNCSATLNLSDPAPAGALVIFRNCKLPASWSGSPINGAFSTPNGRIRMENCSDGAVNYALWIEDFAGSIRSETTFVRTGGATDGTTPLSWKMVTLSSAAAYPTYGLETGEIVIWNELVGSARTVTVHILRDSATNLKDDEIWLEVNYLGSSATPIGTQITDQVASFVTASADQTASTETWNTTGMANPNKQKLNVTFTPNMKGFFICKVVLVKVSTTVYVCPKAEVT